MWLTRLACKKNEGTMSSYVENEYDLDWNVTENYCSDLTRGSFPRPISLELMVQYAKKLSGPFPFVRADFYDVNGNVFFAELTFTPNTNILHYSEKRLEELGAILKLPPKYVPLKNVK